MPVTPREEGPEPRLDERVIDLLIDHPGSVAFNGLRRALNAHPEALARALRRLERDGLVRHAGTGYAAVQVPPDSSGGREPPPRTLVASLDLPPGLTSDEVFGALAGRWFGDLRWLGVLERRDAPSLVWSVADGRGHVSLSVRRGSLRVHADARRGSAGFAYLELAAYDLLRFALTRINPSAPRRSVETPMVGFSLTTHGPPFAS